MFLGVRRQLVGPDCYVAPLKAFANVPNRLLAGAPGREVIELTALLAQPLAADPLETATVRIMAIETGEVELSDLDGRERTPALISFLGAGACDIDMHLLAVGQIAQIDRHRG